MPKKRTAVDAARDKLGELGIAIPGVAQVLLDRLRKDHPDLSDAKLAELLANIKVGGPERTIRATFGGKANPETGAPAHAGVRHLKLAPSPSEPNLLQLSRDGTRAVIRAGTQAIVLALAPTKIEVTATHELPERARYAVDGDARRLACSGCTFQNPSDGSLRVIDLESGVEVGRSEESPHLLAFAPDDALWGITVTKRGVHIAADSAVRWPSHSMEPTRWSLASAPPRLSQPFSFSAGARRAAYLCEDEAVVVATDRFEPLLRFRPPALGRKRPLRLQSVALSPDGNEMGAVCGAGPNRGENPLVLRVDAKGGIVETFNPKEAHPIFYAVAYTASGLRVVYRGKDQNTFLLWASGAAKARPFKFSDPPTLAEISADGRLLVVACATWDRRDELYNCDVTAISLD